MTPLKLARCLLAALLGAVLALPGAAPALAQTPSNDDISNATVIAALPFADMVDTTEASAAPDDPADPSVACEGAADDATVWYTFTPLEEMFIEYDTSGSSYNTTTHIYWHHWSGGLASDGQYQCQSAVAVAHLYPGITYYFLIGSFTPGDGGQLSFAVRRAPPPPTYQLTLNSNASVDSAGTVRITGTLSCNGVGSININAELKQVFSRRYTAQNVGGAYPDCPPAGQTMPWTVVVESGSTYGGVLFGPGKAELILSSWSCTPWFDCSTDSQIINTTLSLRKATR